MRDELTDEFLTRVCKKMAFSYGEVRGWVDAKLHVISDLPGSTQLQCFISLSLVWCISYDQGEVNLYLCNQRTGWPAIKNFPGE